MRISYAGLDIIRSKFIVHFLCLSKENEPKERTLFEGIFKLCLKPSGKLRVAALLNLGALLRLFCRKVKPTYNYQ